MKRILLGTLITVVVYILLNFTTMPLGQAAYQNLFQDAYAWALALVLDLPMFFASLFGALVGGRRFILVALAMWVGPTAYTLHWGYEMQQPARPMGVAEYLGNQLPSLPIGLVATLVGAWLGAELARYIGQKPNTSSKPTPLRGAA